MTNRREELAYVELKDKVVIFDDKNRTQDIIRMDSDIVLTDKHGNEIEVKSMSPEYIRLL